MATSRAAQPRASVWLAERQAPSRKAAPAGLDRERIVKAAIRLLDSEGLARFSMRALATELGVSTMSVYWYVETKDDLLEMALDAVSGELALPDTAQGDDWREDIRRLATEFRGALAAHPWASRLMGEYLNVGPNSIVLSATAQRVMERSGLPRELLPGALSTVFQFVYGFGTVEGQWAERCRAAGMTQDEFFQSVVRTVDGRPEIAGQSELMDQRARSGVAELRERDFAFALDCLIAGIESMVARYGRVG